jgi:Tir chaperone protein (CesT) family
MAVSWERVHDLMTEVGALMDLPQVTELPPEHDYWRVVAADETGIDVDLDRATGRIVLSTALGQPRAQGREALYDMLLAYNGAWRETGGARIGLDEPGGEVVLLFDLAAEGLDAGSLGAVLANLQEVAALWRRLVARGGPAAAAGDGAAADGMPGFMMPGVIRG